MKKMQIITQKKEIYSWVKVSWAIQNNKLVIGSNLILMKKLGISQFLKFSPYTPKYPMEKIRLY